MKKNKIMIIVGSCIIIAGLYIAFYHTLSNRDSIDTKGETSLAYSDNIFFDTLTFSFYTTEEPNRLNIEYSLRSIDQDDGFVAIMLPYKGIIDTATKNWSYKNLPSGYTVLFKKLNCTNKTPCYDENGVVGVRFFEKFDSKQEYTNAVKMPFTNGLQNEEIIDLVNSLKPNGTNILLGWETHHFNPKVELIIDERFKEFNFNPSPDAESSSGHNKEGTNIFVWTLSKDKITILASYNDPKERSDIDNHAALGYVLIGTGVTIILTPLLSPYIPKARKSTKGFGNEDVLSSPPYGFDPSKHITVSFRCEFRFDEPESADPKAAEQTVLQRFQAWLKIVENQADKKAIVRTNNDGSLTYEIKFLNQKARIEFSNKIGRSYMKDGTYWKTLNFMLYADKQDVIDSILTKGGYPCWVIRWNLAEELELSLIAAHAKELTGKDIVSGAAGIVGVAPKITQLQRYLIHEDYDIRLELGRGYEIKDSFIQLVYDGGPPNTGFFHAQKIFSPSLLLSTLYDEISYKEFRALIEKSLSQP